MSQTADLLANSLWQIYGASCIGKSHLDNGMPNQDRIFFQQTATSLVAVVCDGAGSAKLSQDGANYFSQAIGQMLLTVADLDISNLLQTKNLITAQLAHIRDSLQSQLAAGISLRDYHTTFTALLMQHTQQALLVQVGDSPLITSQFVVTDNQIDYFDQLAIYGDDSKNEYVNETHFITQDNWQDFLRVEAIDLTQVDSIALMTDGCADLVFEGASQTPQIYRPFFGNLLFNLGQSQTGEQGNAIIEQALSNPATYRLTGDDKSLIVILTNQQPFTAFEPILQVQSETPSSAAATINTIWHSPNQPTENIHQQVSVNHQIQALNQQVTKIDTVATRVLPPSQTITASTKQRRNTALVAGVAMLVGTGILGWLNKDRFAPSQTITASNAVASAVVSSGAIATVTPRHKSYRLNDAVTVDVSGQNTQASLTAPANDLMLDLIVASPNNQTVLPTTMANNPTAHNKKTGGKQAQHPLLSVNIATMPNKTATSQHAASLTHAASLASATNQIPTASTPQDTQFIHHAVNVAATIDCEPLADANRLVSLGIANQPNFNYQSCQLILPIKAMLPQMPALANNSVIIQQVVFDKGLSQLLTVQDVPANAASAPKLATVNSTSTANVDSSKQIQLYYLTLKPYHFNHLPTNAVNASAATAPTAASTPKR